MSTPKPSPEWYRDWFGQEYLDLYPHRDQDEARDAVQLVLARLGEPMGTVLDLASGAGRHLVEFAERGIRAVGLDLSAPLLRRARAEPANLELVRGDMRQLPFADDAFALVTNFFTSFGYFADPIDDRRVLDELRRVLRPGGRFALDFLNADRVLKHFVSKDERQLGGKRVIQERSLEEDGHVIVKRIRILDGDDESSREFLERVRLYSRDELTALLGSVGLQPELGFGDYDGTEFDANSPRLILMGKTR